MISGSRVAQDFMGSLDKTDYYKFTLDKDTDLNATLSSLSGSVEINLIRNANSNGLIDDNERIDDGIGTAFNSPIPPNLPAGLYFIEVKPGYSTNIAHTFMLAG